MAIRLRYKLYNMLLHIIVAFIIEGILFGVWGIMIFYEWWYTLQFILLIFIAGTSVVFLHDICNGFTELRNQQEEVGNDNTLGCVLTGIMAIPMLFLGVIFVIIPFKEMIESKRGRVIVVDKDGDYSIRYYFCWHDYQYVNEEGKANSINLKGLDIYVDNQYKNILKYYEVEYGKCKYYSSDTESIIQLYYPYTVSKIDKIPDFIMKSPPRSIQVKDNKLSNISVKRTVLEPLK